VPSQKPVGQTIKSIKQHVNKKQYESYRNYINSKQKTPATSTLLIKSDLSSNNGPSFKKEKPQPKQSYQEKKNDLIYKRGSNFSSIQVDREKKNFRAKNSVIAVSSMHSEIKSLRPI
jgi:hypothetical protein